MKKSNSTIFRKHFFTITLICILCGTSYSIYAQWNLTGNSNATATSLLGTTNAIQLNLTTNNISRLVIDANGKVGIGITNPVNIFSVKGAGSTPAASWVSAGAPIFTGFGEQNIGNADFILSMASSAFNARPVFIGRRAKGTLAAPATVANNDQITSFLSSGYDGKAFQNAAAIDFFVDGTPSSGSVPTRISFVTGSNSANRSERLKIGNTGDITLNNNQLFLEKSTGNLAIGSVAPHSSALVDMNSSKKGLLIPRTSTTSRIAISSPAKGLLVYDTTASSFWYYNGGAWVQIGASGNGWSLTGNANTIPEINFIGTTDQQSLVFKVNNQRAGLIDYGTYNSGTRNTAFGQIALNAVSSGMDNAATGYGALYSNTTGSFNAAYGKYSLFNNNADNNTAYGFNTMFFNTTGNNNTATGAVALQNNTAGLQNTATGYASLAGNTTGNYNTATGSAALNNNGDGQWNTAHGAYALYQNSNANYNTAIGGYTLYSNTSGLANTANGYKAMYSNIDGGTNVANGYQALYSNTSGYGNVAAGYNALYSNIDGYDNTAVGQNALNSNTNGNHNVAQGYFSLYSNTSGSDNVAIGANALSKNTIGLHNVAIGTDALRNNFLDFDPIFGADTSSNNTAVGYKALSRHKYGQGNTALGYLALSELDNGIGNTAIGSGALAFGTNGNSTGTGFNTAVGYNALHFGGNGLPGGGGNVAIGVYALYSNIDGTGNTAIGTDALVNNINGGENTAIGDWAGKDQTKYDNCTMIGNRADMNVSGLYYSTAIGYLATISSSNQVRIGSIGITDDPTSIGGKVGWSTLSDGRVKKNIKANVPGLAFINKLHPVTYNFDANAINQIIDRVKTPKQNKSKYNLSQLASKEVNKKEMVYSGFIAQEVEKAAKSVNYDFSGVDEAKNDKDLYGLRYAEFVVPLVKAVQELSLSNEAKEKKIADQEKTNQNLQKQIDELKATLLQLVNQKTPCTTSK